MKWKLFLAFLLGIANLPAADWPNWRGPNFDGISTETDWDPEKIDNVLWKTEVGPLKKLIFLKKIILPLLSFPTLS
mgnify:CR=1 FL=1